MPRLLSTALLLALPTFAFAQDAKPLPPAEAKKAFLKLLDRPKVPADPKVVEFGGRSPDGPTWERLTFASEKKADGALERVPVLVVKPNAEKVRRPAAVVLHGTGGNKDAVRSWLDEFARQGVVGIAIDARYHGDRVPGAKGSAAYVAAITKAWQTPAGKPQEHPFYYDTVWDLWRLVDYLRTREDIDPDRIGMLGISMGGIQTWLAASVDDRVAVAAPLIGVQSLRWSLDHDKWQGRARTIAAAHAAAAKDLGEKEVNQKVCRALWGKVIPGITSDFDGPNLLPLFAPRPLFVCNGELDPNCPIEGARLAFQAAEEAYAKAGAKDKLVIDVAEGVPHKVTDEQRKAAIAFMTKWLKK